MILMDTDHVSVLQHQGAERRSQLLTRIQATTGEVVGTTIVTIEEQMRGWLSAISREKMPRRHVFAYRQLAGLFQFFQGFYIALFDEAAFEHFDRLRAAKVRIGTMDLKIASIALANDALLLTSNRVDFEKVPDLRFENWLD